GAAAVIKPGDTLDDHAYATISGGDWLCDQDAVEIFVKESPEELLRLEHWGCPWSRDPDGHIAVRAFGGMKKMRTWFAADKTGFHLLHTLFQTTLKYKAVTRYDEWFVTKLLVDEGRVQGVVALQLMSGRIQAITAKSVILCAGGCGRVFPFTTNASIKTGDGMGLAYRAGAPLKDMEFIQYHPTGLPFTGILITEAARAEGGYLVNKDGYRYLQDYNLGTPTAKPVLRSMELGPRDRLSQDSSPPAKSPASASTAPIALAPIPSPNCSSSEPGPEKPPPNSPLPRSPSPIPSSRRPSTNSVASKANSFATPPAANAFPPFAKRCSRPWRPAPGSIAPNPLSPPAQKLFASSRSAPTILPSTITPSPSTPTSSPPWSFPSCSTSPNPWSNPRSSAPNPAAPTSAPTSPSATTKNSSPTLSFSAPPTHAP